MGRPPWSRSRQMGGGSEFRNPAQKCRDNWGTVPEMRYPWPGRPSYSSWGSSGRRRVRTAALLVTGTLLNDSVWWWWWWCCMIVHTYSCSSWGFPWNFERKNRRQVANKNIFKKKFPKATCAAQKRKLKKRHFGTGVLIQFGVTWWVSIFNFKKIFRPTPYYLGLSRRE